VNPKAKREKGQRIAIGVLAKYNIDVAIPLSDNLPFDLVLIINGRLFRAQVKSSERKNTQTEGSIVFGLTTNNWYSKTSKKYSPDEIDVMLLCDYEHLYILTIPDFIGRSTFTIRTKASKNGQVKGMHMHDDFVISEKRIKEVFED
jgi:hypothetical protein